MPAETCRNFLMRAAALAIFATLSVGVGFAHHHHELNGTWQLLPARSELHGAPAVETGTVTINDRDGNVYVNRSFNYDAANQSASTAFSTDAHVKTSIKEPGFKSKAKWEGDTLRVVTMYEGGTMTERYSLLPDGVLMLQVDRTGHQPETLYFQRQ